MPNSTDLQTSLDNITTRTRDLVQPSRLAITDDAVQALFLTGIEDRILPVGATAPTFDLPDAAATTLTNATAANTKLVHSSDLLGIGPPSGSRWARLIRLRVSSSGVIYRARFRE